MTFATQTTNNNKNTDKKQKKSCNGTLYACADTTLYFLSYK